MATTKKAATEVKVTEEKKTKITATKKSAAAVVEPVVAVAKATKTTKKAAPVVSVQTTADAPKVSAFMKELSLSADLVKIVGAKTMARTEVTKQIWVYIKEHNLQDAADKRMIKPDAKLAKVLGSEPVHMMKMAGSLNKHMK